MTPRLAAYGRVVGQASIAAGVGAMFAGRIGADLTALYRAQATVEKIRGFMAPRAENDQ